jgi:hypothetical protein
MMKCYLLILVACYQLCICENPGISADRTGKQFQVASILCRKLMTYREDTTGSLWQRTSSAAMYTTVSGFQTKNISFFIVTVQREMWQLNGSSTRQQVLWP